MHLKKELYDDYINLIENLKYIRKIKKLMIKDVEMELGVINTISKVENLHRKISVDLILRLCKLYGVSVDWVFNNKERSKK